MEKNTFEMFGYLPVSANNSQPASDEFLVVQGDGTFLVNKQVQYVTKVEDDKAVLEREQPCTVYDLSHILVDDNSPVTELVSISENYMLSDESSSLYANGYLLQTVSSSSAVQEDVAEQFIVPNTQEIVSLNNENKADGACTEVLDDKSDGACTEITLTDEQYSILEQKGSVLLEINDKVFLLDAMGLHDITSNQELIQQLKADDETNAPLEIDTRPMDIESIPVEKTITENINTEDQRVECIIENNIHIKSQENISEIPLSKAEDSVEEKPVKELTTDNEKNIKTEDIINCTTEPQAPKASKVVRIKTNFSFKDIPEKIFLGKTVSGKNLVARVVQCTPAGGDPTDKPDKKRTQRAKKLRSGKEYRENIGGRTSPEKSVFCTPEETDLLEWQLERMIWRALHKNELRCNAQQVAAASDDMKQLMQMPAFNLTVDKRNLIITKVIQVTKRDIPTEIVLLPSVITGQVKTIDEERRFVHMPKLLLRLKDGPEKDEDKVPLSDYSSVLHIHITETMGTNNCEGVKGISITITNKSFTELRKNPPRKIPSKVYACSSCAAVFQSVLQLTSHTKENQCMEFEDRLMIDMDRIPREISNVKLNPYYIIKSDKGDVYACLQCSSKFNKLSNCRRHIKTHEMSEGKGLKVYKCKMCPCSYGHRSSLSKHIVAAHIRVRSNN